MKYSVLLVFLLSVLQSCSLCRPAGPFKHCSSNSRIVFSDINTALNNRGFYLLTETEDDSLKKLIIDKFYAPEDIIYVGASNEDRYSLYFPSVLASKPAMKDISHEVWVIREEGGYYLSEVAFLSKSRKGISKFIREYASADSVRIFKNDFDNIFN